MRLKSMRCPLCSSGAAWVRFRGPDRTLDRPEAFEVTACSDCGFRYTSPRPLPEDMHQFYPDSYGPYQPGILSGSEIFNSGKSYADRLKNRIKWSVLSSRYGYAGLAPPEASETIKFWANELTRLLGSMLYRHMRYYYPRVPHWRQGGKALDIGCGNGAHLLLLKRLGWDVSGFDLSDHTAPEVKAAGINMFAGKFSSLSSLQSRFDLITMWHVLEHVDDPLDTLRSVRQMLSPHGLLMVEVPNCESVAARVFGSHWVAYDLPRHLSHFTLKTAWRLIEKAGLEVVHAGYSWKQHVAASVTYAVQRQAWAQAAERFLQSATVQHGLKVLGHFLALAGAGEIVHFTARRATD